MNRQFTYSLNRLYDNSTQLGQLLQDNTYVYDNVGCLIYFTTPRIQASQNAAALTQHASLAYPTLYASALITFNKGGYTKHYFEGTNRVCSKIGGGFSNINLDSIAERVPALAED